MSTLVPLVRNLAAALFSYVSASLQSLRSLIAASQERPVAPAPHYYSNVVPARLAMASPSGRAVTVGGRHVGYIFLEPALQRLLLA